MRSFPIPALEPDANLARPITTLPVVAPLFVNEVSISRNGGPLCDIRSIERHALRAELRNNSTEMFTSMAKAMFSIASKSPALDLEFPQEPWETFDINQLSHLIQAVPAEIKLVVSKEQMTEIEPSEGFVSLAISHINDYNTEADFVTAAKTALALRGLYRPYTDRETQRISIFNKNRKVKTTGYKQDGGGKIPKKPYPGYVNEQGFRSQCAHSIAIMAPKNSLIITKGNLSHCQKCDLLGYACTEIRRKLRKIDNHTAYGGSTTYINEIFIVRHGGPLCKVQ